MRRVVCLVLVLALVGTVCGTSFALENGNQAKRVNGNGGPPPNPQETGSLWDFLLQYCFASHNAMHAALFFQAAAQGLRNQAMARELDVSGVDDLLAKADALLAEALVCFEKGDCRCAGRKALDAVYLYLQAISALTALLSG